MAIGLASVVQSIPTKERTTRETTISPSSDIGNAYVSEQSDYLNKVEEMNERDSYSSCWDSND